MRKRLTLFCFLTLCFTSHAQDWGPLVQRLGSSVCFIEIVRGGVTVASGSGFAMNGAGSVLTNYHVIADGDGDPRTEVYCTFTRAGDSSVRHKAAIESASSQEDLAILHIDRTTEDYLTLSSRDSPSLMTEILVMGYPLGQGFKGTPGLIQAFQTIYGRGEMYDLSASVDPGSSGGPVLNGRGEVIGVVTAQIRGYNFNLALPLEAVRGFVEKAGKPEMVRISSIPEKSRIFADGRFFGTTPLEMGVFSRSIELRIEADGYEPEELTLQPGMVGETLEVRLTPLPRSTVTVMLDTVPSGARIWVDNRDMGESPLQFEAEPSSRIRVLAKLRRHEDLFQTVRIGTDPDQTVVLEF